MYLYLLLGILVPFYSLNNVFHMCASIDVICSVA